VRGAVVLQDRRMPPARPSRHPRTVLRRLRVALLVVVIAAAVFLGGGPVLRLGGAAIGGVLGSVFGGE